jgi:hypothetical protein
MAEMVLSRDEIIDRCDKAGPQDLISHTPYGNSVLKLSDSVAVKFGNGVTQYEAYSQEKAYLILDRGIVRVPKVYGFFDDGRGRGYLVMEFIEGETQESFTSVSQLHALSRVLDHFATQKSEKPGPLGGGPSPALLFGESDPPTFETIEEIERWCNIRHLVTDTTLSLQGLELVLSHLDLFPRNILWLSDQPPCVLDWASAGYYPRIFEACSQLIRTRLEQSGGVLQIPIPDYDTNRVSLIIKAWENAQKFHL